MDLETLDTRKGADAGFELHLTHPRTGEALPMVINLLGADSRVYQDAQRTQNRRRLAEAQKVRRMTLTPEALEADALELLVAVTRGWSGFTQGGKAVDCTPQNVQRIYTEFPWIREQVDLAIGDRANFLPSSPTPS